MWFFYACCRCSMRSSLPGQPRSDISQNLCPATQCTHAAACSMRTTFLYLANPATQCTHAAACSMRTLCTKILRNITSRLARQKIWKNYACSMRRKSTSLTVLASYSCIFQKDPSNLNIILPLSIDRYIMPGGAYWYCRFSHSTKMK